MSNIFKLFNYLSFTNRLKFLYVTLISVFSAFVELLSVIIIIPIIQIITNQKISTIGIFSKSQNFISTNLKIDEKVTYFLIFALITLLTSMLRYFVLKKTTYFSFELGSFFSELLFKKTINKSYDSYLNSDSSEVLVDITLRIDKLIGNVILPILTIITSSSIVIFLFTYLLLNFLYPTIFIISFSFALIFVINSMTTKKLNNERETANSYLNKVVSNLQDVIGLYREIIIKNYFKIVEKEFVLIDNKLRKSQAICQLETSFPKFTVEPILLIFILGLAQYINNSQSFLSLTFLGIFIFAAQKITPLINVIFSSYISLKVSSPIIESFYKTLNEEQENSNYVAYGYHDFDKIIFSDVSFGYKNSATLFNNLNLEISKGDKIAIIGDSGSGKSTFINLLMGFLIPKKGDVYFSYNGEIFNDIRLLRSNLSLMPQTVYLKNDTILKNITLYSDLNMELLEKVIRKVKLDDFVFGQKDGINTKIGENGITISGGQRQRIALARALYSGSTILILDEATSALDSKSSSELVETLCSLKELTILFITHNKKLSSHFDKCIEVKNGTIFYLKN